jgi:hypothetical protein
MRSNARWVLLVFGSGAIALISGGCLFRFLGDFVADSLVYTAVNAMN